jgi:hypothetical protein
MNFSAEGLDSRDTIVSSLSMAVTQAGSLKIEGLVTGRSLIAGDKLGLGLTECCRLCMSIVPH